MRARPIWSPAHRSSIRLRVPPRTRHQPVSPSARDTCPSPSRGQPPIRGRHHANKQAVAACRFRAMYAFAVVRRCRGRRSRPSWRRKSMPQRVPERVPRKSRRDPLGFRRLQLVRISELPKSGRWDSNPRRPAWEGGGKTSADCSTRQISSEDAMLTMRVANPFVQNSASNGSGKGSRPDTVEHRNRRWHGDDWAEMWRD